MFGEKFVIVGSLRETSVGPMLVGDCRKQFASGGYSWMNAIGLPGFAAAGVLTSSQVSGWDKLPEPDKQLFRIAEAVRKQTRGARVRVVAVYGNLQSVFVLESAKCKDRSCAAQIHYPPMDLINIQGVRELK
jgi:hypothetical protein